MTYTDSFLRNFDHNGIGIIVRNLPTVLQDLVVCSNVFIQPLTRFRTHIQFIDLQFRTPYAYILLIVACCLWTQIATFALPSCRGT